MEYDEEIIKERVHSNLLCNPSAVFLVKYASAIQAVSSICITVVISGKISMLSTLYLEIFSTYADIRIKTWKIKTYTIYLLTICAVIMEINRKSKPNPALKLIDGNMYSR